MAKKKSVAEKAKTIYKNTASDTEKGYTRRAQQDAAQSTRTSNRASTRSTTPSAAEGAKKIFEEVWNDRQNRQTMSSQDIKRAELANNRRNRQRQAERQQALSDYAKSRPTLSADSGKMRSINEKSARARGEYNQLRREMGNTDSWRSRNDSQIAMDNNIGRARAQGRAASYSDFSLANEAYDKKIQAEKDRAFAQAQKNQPGQRQVNYSTDRLDELERGKRALAEENKWRGNEQTVEQKIQQMDVNKGLIKQSQAIVDAYENAPQGTFHTEEESLRYAQAKRDIRDREQQNNLLERETVLGRLSEGWQKELVRYAGLREEYAQGSDSELSGAQQAQKGIDIDKRRQVIQKATGLSDEEMDLAIDAATRQYNANKADLMQQRASDMNTAELAVSNALTVFNNFAKAKDLPAVVQAVIDDVPVDTNAMGATLYNDIIRGESSDRILKSKVAPGLANFLYQTTMSMADFLVMMPLNTPDSDALSLALMGTGAGMEAVKEGTERGLDARHALVTGVLAGAFEAMFEKVSIETLLNPKAGDGALRYILKNTLAEGSEEVCTDIANNISDILVNGGLSEYRQNILAYVRQGYTQEEASTMAAQDFAKNLALSFAGGALSGAVMSSFASLSPNFRAESLQDQIDALDVQTRELINDAFNPAQGRLVASADTMNQIMSNIQQMQEMQQEQVEIYEKQNPSANNSNALDALDSDNLDSSFEGAAVEDSLGEESEAVVPEERTQFRTIEEAEQTLDAISDRIAETDTNDPALEELSARYQEVSDIIDDWSGYEQTRNDTRNAGERNVQMDTEERGGRSNGESTEVGEQGSGSNEIRESAQRTTDELQKAGITRGKTADFLGAIGTDTDGQSAEIPENVWKSLSDADTYQAIYDNAKSNGVDVHFVSGLMQVREGGRTIMVDGIQMANGQRYITIDSETKTAAQIDGHEDLHWVLDTTTNSVAERRAAIDRMIETVSANEGFAQFYQDLAEQNYIFNGRDSFYDADGNLDENLFYYEAEELLANAHGDIDIAAKDRESKASRYTDTVKKAATEQRANARRGPPADVAAAVKKAEAGQALTTEEEFKASIALTPQIIGNAQKYNSNKDKIDKGEAGFVSAADMDIGVKQINEVHDMMVKPKVFNSLPEDIQNDVVQRDKNGKKISTLRKNGSYGISGESMTVCIRTLATHSLMDAVAKKLGHPLTVKESLWVAQTAWDYLGDIGQCVYCYVEMDRMARREYRGRYLEQREEVLGWLRDGMSVKDAQQKYAKETLKRSEGNKTTNDRVSRWARILREGGQFVTADMVTDEETIAEVVKNNPAVRTELNDLVRYAQSASYAKAELGYSAYTGEILRMSKDLVKKLNQMFGIRFYSFSDFHPAFYLENMQMVLDASVRGLKGLGYTKDVQFAKAFEPTNMNINISIFAEQYPTRDGSFHEDAMQGAKWEEAKAVRAESIKNGTGVGIVMVATSDEQVDWAIAQDWIDVVIPFHMVKTGAAVADAFHWKNYTQFQKDMRDPNNKNWKKGNGDIMPNEHQNDYDTYMDELDKQGLKPRFEHWLKFDTEGMSEAEIKQRKFNAMKLVNETRRAEGSTPVMRPRFNLDGVREHIDSISKGNELYRRVGGNAFEEEGIAEDIAKEIQRGDHENGPKYLAKEPDYVRQARENNAKVDELLGRYNTSRALDAGALGEYRDGLDDVYDLLSNVESFDLEYEQVVDGLGSLEESIDQVYDELLEENVSEDEIERVKQVAHWLDEAYRDSKVKSDEIIAAIAREEDAKAGKTVDSMGRQLSEQQAEYFAESKIRDSKGNLIPMYHGTDADFTVFNFDRGGEHGTAEGFGIYLASDREVSEHYGERMIESYVDMKRPARSDKKTIKLAELKKLIKQTCMDEAQAMAEDYGGKVKDALKDTWVSNYTYTYDKSMENAYDEVARTILAQNDSDMEIVQEVMAGMAIRTYDAAMPFYDTLTDLTGIDGFITSWQEGNKGNDNIIALAFRSEQVKNVDNVSPTSDPDIRYSRSLDDQEYLRADENNDGETMRRIVDKVAQENGYTLAVYHGTGEFFNVFRRGEEGIHLGNYDQAAQVANLRYEDRAKYTTYRWNQVKDRFSEMSREARQDVVDRAYELGDYYDGAENTWFSGNIDDVNAVAEYAARQVEAYRKGTNQPDADPAMRLRTFDRQTGRNVMRLYAKINNPFVINGDILEWTTNNIASTLLEKMNGKTSIPKLYSEGEIDISGSDADFSEADADTLVKIAESKIRGDDAWRALSEVFAHNGYDGIKYLNQYEGDKNSYSYIALNPEDVKAADMRTFDDNGDLILPSERFNNSNSDIRYSRDAETEQKVKEISAKKRKSKEDRIFLRDAGEKLSEKDFYALYNVHKLDLRGNGNVDEQVESIKRDGFRGDGGFGYNVMPATINNVSRYTEAERRAALSPYMSEEEVDASIKDLRENPGRGEWYEDTYFPEINVMEGRYGGRAGDTVLLVPEHETVNGERVKNGFKPFDYEVVKVERAFQPYYELYSKAYDAAHGVAKDMSADDQAYMAAAENGDTETAQKMVDEAAKAAGYTIKAYHGTPTGGFTQFDLSKRNYGRALGDGIYFTDDPRVAKQFTGRQRLMDGPDNAMVYEGYINLGDNPLVIDLDALRKEHGKKPIFINYLMTDEIEKKGPDASAIVIRGIKDGSNISSTVYVLKGSEQFKSADPITYDDDGNIIPLSERFNTENEDIRYSRAIEDDDTETLRQTIKDLTKTVDTIRKQKEYWKNQTKTSTPSVTQTSANKMAEAWIERTGSTMKKSEVAAKIKELGDWLRSGSDDISILEARKRARVVAKDLMDSAEILVNDVEMEAFDDIKKSLKQNMMISPTDASNIPDFEDWRKHHFGQINIRKGTGGLMVDQAYQELSAAHPEYFPEDIAHPADQLLRMADVYDSMEPVFANPYDSDYDAALAAYETLMLEDAITMETTAPTFADRKEAEIERIKQIAEDRLQRVRQQRDEKVAKMKEQFSDKLRETKQKNREKQQINKRRDQIMRHTKDLSNKLLKPTDKAHIPQDLQGAVAKLLESINTGSAEGKATKRTEAFNELLNLYEKMSDSLTIDPDMLGADGYLQAAIGLKDKSIMDMNLQELETVWNAIRGVETTIMTANKTFASSKWERISDVTEALYRDLSNREETSNGTISKFMTDNLTPEAFFHRLGEAGDEIFHLLRQGQNDYIRIMKEAADVTAKLDTDFKALEKQEMAVTLGGKTVKMSTAQLMNLYILCMRPQALQHVLQGGIRPTARKRGLRTVEPSEAVKNVTQEELVNAFNMLSNEQKEVCKALQEYVSTDLAKHGNEAALKVYNYEKFGENNYWPIKSDSHFTKSDTKDNKMINTSVAGKGMAKALVPNANNPVMIGSVFDVFSEHVQDMAAYAAWLAPMEDINRIRNYIYKEQVKDENGNVRMATLGSVQELTDKTVARGASYWEKLMSDLSNGVEAEKQYFGGLAGSFKAAAIGANIRVIIQQPTAIARAYDMISPKYLNPAAAGHALRGWKRALDHSAIAQWKDWGYFDVNTGRTMKSVLFDTDTALDKTKNALSFGAGAADSFAWGILWNACEAETKALHKDLKPGTEEFYDKVAERFEAIIDHSQVVDGVLQRSQLMRSGDGLKKMATSFMGEPTKQANQFMSAMYDVKHSTGTAKKKAKGKMARTVVAMLLAGLLNSAAQSIIDGFRNKDREKKYGEKWVESFLGITGDEEKFTDYAKEFLLDSNVGDLVNPLTYFPYAKDIWSIFTGYDVERMDLSVVSDTWDSVSRFAKAWGGDSKYTKANATADLISNASKLLGVPLSNLKRDLEAGAYRYIQATDNYVWDYRLTSFLYTQKNNKKEFIDILWMAKEAGDQEAYDIIYQDLLEKDQLATSSQSTEDYIKAQLKKREAEKTKNSQDFASKRDSATRAVENAKGWGDLNDAQQSKIKQEITAWAMDTGSTAGAEYVVKNQPVPEGLRDTEAGKIIEGSSSLTAEDYFSYRVALFLADRPTESGKTGTYNQGEIAYALQKASLSDKERRYIWSYYYDKTDYDEYIASDKYKDWLKGQ